MSRRVLSVFIVGLVLGLLVRVAVLRMPGTGDVTCWKVWSYAATTIGVAGVYGIGGNPPEWRELEYDGERMTINYGPVTVFELAAVGHLYKAWKPRFANTKVFTAAVKTPMLLADLGLTLLCVWAVRRRYPALTRRACWAGLAYWLNPGVLMIGAVLGYIDPLFAFPSVAAVVAAAAGHPAIGAGLLMLGVLSKPQALLVAPVLVVAAWRVGQRVQAGHRGSGLRAVDWGWALAQAGRLALGAAATTLVVFSPYLAAGSVRNMLLPFQFFGHQPMLSAYAANFWWLVTYVMRAAYEVHGMGFVGAFLPPVKRILDVPTLIWLGYPNPRPWATLTVLAITLWAMWRARKASDLFLLAGLGAFIVHAYFMFAIAVHENHLYLAIPLLALASAGRPRYMGMLIAVSLIQAIDLNIFYGMGDYVGYAIPRTLTIIDVSVVLSLVSLAVFVWHVRLFKTECQVAL
jgi:hypothetical protein